VWTVEAVPDFDTKAMTTDVKVEILRLRLSRASQGSRCDDEGSGSCKGTSLGVLNELGH